MSSCTRIKTQKRRYCEAAVWHTRIAPERGEPMSEYERLKFSSWIIVLENRRALAEMDRAWEVLGAAVARDEERKRQECLPKLH